ncbi:recombinase family protein [Miltoncostaea oceani]|uniref:recombinase family protein n=1 Tax=Miltoncostaea oceani TaxID=2843216 RepID=UPI001C3E55ED|nr:recombinase family protein [Miltoncostaea oceani]
MEAEIVRGHERACRDAITAIDPSPVSITVIEGIDTSGGAEGPRARLGGILELLRTGQADAVMAHSATRIAPDAVQSMTFWDDCVAAGAFIASVDFPALMDGQVRSIITSIKEGQAAERGDASTALIRHRRAKGLPPVKGGRAYGVRWDGNRLAPDPEEWSVVLRVFRDFDSGLSISRIARDLSAAGIPRREAGHSQWSASGVSQMLRRTWYIGLVPDGDGYWDSGHDLLAEEDPQLWGRVKDRLEERRVTGQNLDHALSGLLYCGRCEGWSPMSLCYGRNRLRDGSIVQTDRYRCIHHVHDRSFCQGQSLAAPATERHLVAQITAMIDGDELSLARAARADGAAPSAEDVARLTGDAAAEQPFDPETWMTYPPGRRNTFLRLAFPSGVFIDAPPARTRPGVDKRIRLRTPRDVEAAEVRRRSAA